MPPLVLASSSPYRAQLLARLQIPFTVAAPSIDESPRADEAPADTALRLAITKAQTVARVNPGALVIGSDQVAHLAGRPLGKPGSMASAREQLRAASGREVCFHTALALLGAVRQAQSECVATRVRFRELDDASIDAYLAREPALDCAGSAKIEGLGISLIAAVDSTDPTALIGLPLIALCSMLRREGVTIPA